MNRTTHTPADVAPEQPHGHGEYAQATAEHDHRQGVPSRAALAGHPLHAMLIPFPIAFLLAALVADLAAWGTDDAFWARAAWWLMGAGVVSGVLAALFGLVDFLTIERARVHRIGWVHALSAGATLALATASWLLRLGDPIATVWPWSLVLSALTAAALAVAGWTGGDLPYRHLIGVSGHGGHDHNQTEVETPMTTDSHAHSASAILTARTNGHAEHDCPDMNRHQDQRGIDHAAPGHAALGHAAADPASAVTRPQLAAVTLLTLLALTAAIAWSSSYANLSYSAKQVGGAVMPPGMIQTRDLPAEAMREMAAVDPRQVAFTAPAEARGDQPLAPRFEGGVKVFELETSVIRWHIVPGVPVAAYAFNGQVPGPRLRVTEGDQVRITVTNRLPEPTTVHWHGLILANAMDGPSHITQEPIPPGGRFTYEFTARQHGTFFYHSHHEADRQQALGLYGALIIDPRDSTGSPAADQEVVIQLQEWTFKEGYTFPAMPMEGALPNYFTINGKAYPATETVRMKVGERLHIRFIGSNSAFVHPMHVHGGPFRIVATDGQPVPAGAQIEKDTINVGPGERYDVIWEARAPGRWLLHCHINHHTTNNNREEQGAGGLTLVIEVIA